jgi:hypothetical protein
MKNQGNQGNLDHEFWLAVRKQLLAERLRIYLAIEPLLDELDAVEQWLKLVNDLVDPPE